MGCCKSLQPAGKAELMKEGKGVDFRDAFIIGNRIGEGAFGTVFECRKRTDPDNIVYAVKMMEHQSSWWGKLSSSQEAQWQMFAQEFKMMNEVSHPNLIRMVGVFIDDLFVYFVMDKYECNLINAVLPFLKKAAKGLPQPALAEIVAQMLASVAYLHSLSIVHRDVKADNYLVDGTTFKNRAFKIVLSDMSTARYLEEDVFLKDIVGTREYWAPELVARSYSHKVDVWAVGIVFWCMITTKFPFSNVQERFTKKLTIKDNMTQEQFSLVDGMLTKSPFQRMSAKQASEHAWVVTQCKKHHASLKDKKESGSHRNSLTETADTETASSNVEIEIPEGEKGFGATRQAAAANAGREEQQRIAEKMKLAENRFKTGEKVAMNLEAKLNGEGKEGDTVSTSKQRQGESRTYEWWGIGRCRQKGVPDSETLCEKSDDKAEMENYTTMCAGDSVVGELADTEYLASLLKSCGVDVSKLGVGQAKTLSDLFRELRLHECTLLIRDGTLIRVVDLVVLRVETSDGKRLVEAKQIFPDGRSRDVKRLPAVMCRAKGKGRETAFLEIRRLLESEIHAGLDVVSLNVQGMGGEMNIEMSTSQSYPGLKSIYRRFFINATVNTKASTTKLAAIGIPGGCSFTTSLEDGTKVNWEWWDQEKCDGASLPVNKQQAAMAEFEGFQKVMVEQALTEDTLKELLKKHKIDTALFGVGDARTISQLVTEVNSGETSLFEKPDRPGELRRYLEILIVKIHNAMGAYLVETAHTFGAAQKRERNLFPATKVRPFEDKIWAVRRLLRELDIPFANARTSFGPRRTESSNSPSYPNIATVYIKQVVDVQLEEIDVISLDETGGESAKWYNKQNTQGRT